MLSPTEKRYLLAVLLTLDEGSTRLKKVSDFLRVKMPSAKQILEELASKKLINYVRRAPFPSQKRVQNLPRKNWSASTT
ncbi:hypothetical protein [Thermotoga neapolitana]|uniref:hypothetical protein n=1 Tax=Thermotoga neapolitana TaxID=2337 RepID=UPI000B2FDAAF|nr:hypothetical protein [Thermotoga neapolitana]